MSLPAKHYFGTKDLVTIAGVACMGGVASTYLGYIGHLLGAATGIPVLSQVTVGIHVLWLVLILALLNKKGDPQTARRKIREKAFYHFIFPLEKSIPSNTRVSQVLAGF